MEGRTADPDTERLLTKVEGAVVIPWTYRSPRVLRLFTMDGPTATKVPSVLRDDRVVWADAVRYPFTVVWDASVPMVVFP